MASGKRHSRLVHDFKGFSKGEEVAKVNKAVIEMTNKLNLGVGEDDIELLEREFLRN